MGIYRLEFSKGPEVRYLSHLEMMRTFQRALRRAELPLAFSEGFNPHPKMSFASALAVGVTSENEYMDLELKENLEPEEIMERLNQSLPSGLKVKRCIMLSQKGKALMAMVGEAHYHIKVKLLHALSQTHIQEAITSLLKKKSIIIEKKGKKGPKKKEIRPGIIKLECVGVDEEWVKFTLAVQAGSEKNIRPEEVMKALQIYEKLPIDLELAIIHRKGLFKKGQEQLMPGPHPAFKE